MVKEYKTTTTKVVIENGITSIDDYAFLGCSAPASVTIGKGVTRIDTSAFASCSALTSVTIPDSVTSIDDTAFGGCSKLKSVTVEATNPPRLGIAAFDSTASSLKIYVPSGSVAAYKNNWSSYSSKIQAKQ